jgi:hypothetical protein
VRLKEEPKMNKGWMQETKDMSHKHYQLQDCYRKMSSTVRIHLKPDGARMAVIWVWRCPCQRCPLLGGDNGSFSQANKPERPTTPGAYNVRPFEYDVMWKSRGTACSWFPRADHQYPVRQNWSVTHTGLFLSSSTAYILVGCLCTWKCYYINDANDPGLHSGGSRLE